MNAWHKEHKSRLGLVDHMKKSLEREHGKYFQRRGTVRCKVEKRTLVINPPPVLKSYFVVS